MLTIIIIQAVFLCCSILPTNGLVLPHKTSIHQRIVDLRSDTVTKPTQAMRKAIFDAQVGDDVFQEDPTINLLEERAAKLFGKEKSLFFPTGTMSNLAACMSWCQNRGGEMILGDSSHIHIYEQGGVSQIGGIATHVLPTQPDGTLDLDQVEASIRHNNIHYPKTELISIENTHNNCGGRILPSGYTEALSRLARNKQIPIHLDGARIWNAAAATQTPVASLVEDADSINACLSKGLGAPAGSLLIGTKEFIHRARRIRKVLGGGMRQVGILAAAGLQALDDFNDGILEIDHNKAHLLAVNLSQVPGIQVFPDLVQTNIIVVHLASMGDCLASQFVEFLKERGIFTLPRGPKSLRVVIHRDISDDDLEYTLKAFQEASAVFCPKPTQSRQSQEERNEGFQITGADQSFPDDSEAFVSDKHYQLPITEFEDEPSDEIDFLREEVSENVPSNLLAQADEVPANAGEIATIYGMSPAVDGFYVFLQGMVSDRILKVPVTPSDPMVDGLDLDQVESSEAVTLLQLLQGIDVETHLPKTALATKFHDKQRYALWKVIINALGNRSNRLFEAKLCGCLHKRTTTAIMKSCNTPLSSNMKESDDIEVTNQEMVEEAVLMNKKIELLLGMSKRFVNSTCKEVDSTIAFEAIGLALRHHAIIEVGSGLLQDPHVSCTVEELHRDFPKLFTAADHGKETVDPEDCDDLAIKYQQKLEIYFKCMQEAFRQKNHSKVGIFASILDKFMLEAENALVRCESNNIDSSESKVNAEFEE